jgi:hypothetical protein
MNRKLVRFLVFCITALCIVSIVLLLPQPAPNSPPDSAPIDLQPVIAQAINFLKDSDEPDALMMLNVMYRRFGIEEFADALQRYDQILAQGSSEASRMRVFRRIADHDNPLLVGDYQALTADVDFVTVPALYCDQVGLSAGYPVVLETAKSRGDYLLTHALLAWIWLQENGCEVSLPSSFIQDLYRANAALIGEDLVVDDLKLEAAAFLYLAGQGARVEDAFVDRVVAVQNDDGGWPVSSVKPGDSSWHSTILALFVLLHVEHPANSYPPMLAPASP